MKRENLWFTVVKCAKATSVYCHGAFIYIAFISQIRRSRVDIALSSNLLKAIFHYGGFACTGGATIKITD